MQSVSYKLLQVSFKTNAASEAQSSWRKNKKQIQKFSVSAGGLSLLCWINFLQVANDA